MAQAHSGTQISSLLSPVVTLKSLFFPPAAACTNHVPVITTLLRGGMWRLPPPLPAFSHSHVQHASFSLFPQGPVWMPWTELAARPYTWPSRS